jgi:hypothetical protein
MFFQLLYIHLFRPFLKYSPENSPLPANVSPRKLCTQAAAMISKLLRLYKRSHGLRQICNICVYIAHSACTIHLLNLPEKNAKRDIIHGVKHLEEIAEGWLCARRTLGILSVLVKRWKVDLPEEAAIVLVRTESKFGPWSDISTPKATNRGPAQIIDEQSPTQVASPSLQPYSMSIAEMSAPQFQSVAPTTPAAANYPLFESQSSPHANPNTPTYPQFQSHTSDPLSHAPANQATLTPTTPASAHAQQPLANQPATSTSPSHLFGGVDPMREGQDWIFRDQSQLASGFDNWTTTFEDVSSWFANTPPGSYTPTSNTNVLAPDLNGGGGGSVAPVYAAGMGSVPGGVVGPGNGAGRAVGMGGLQGFTYDENSWYQ